MADGGEKQDPTLEQLARFACVQTLGPYYTDRDVQLAVGVLSNSVVEDGWRRRHREFQEALGG